ncbi:hypothetical protein VIGAN_11107400 [Vigna angularis var. angularis]|uniref:Uncharacterized protein n=1 Tax=Vigna angularis var. angularis TaxID=157739 RepID=A0A0S3T974_PHAAN|nr:hypothetical protein VIGAN_11107400 [Vigna angularis var. angularis]
MVLLPSTVKLSCKISTFPICVIAAKLSHSILLLFPSAILSRVVARSSQERFLDFWCLGLEPLDYIFFAVWVYFC